MLALLYNFCKLIYANNLVVKSACFSLNTVKSYEQCFILPFQFKQ